MSNTDTEKLRCRECHEQIFHAFGCDFNRATHGNNTTSPVLDSERKDLGRMAEATAESLDRERMKADGITDEDIWETRTTPDWRLE